MNPARMLTILIITAVTLVSGGQVPSLPDGLEYQGRVSENGGVVQVFPEIRAENGPICGFRIVNTDWGKIPFEIFMKSPENGTAELKARHPLNCETKESYELTIAAVACNGQISESRRIHVYVDDVNEFIPLWSEQEYNGQLEEGDLSSFILQVEATDNDCSPNYGDVCKYSISGSEAEAVFSVDQQGIITNTQPLWSRESRSHVLSVVATDCGGKESSPVLVTITVTPRCSTAWSDVSTSMTYIPGTGPQPVFPAAHLSLCPLVCPLSHLETTLTLHTDHTGQGCDRDTYSLQSQRKMCGASNQAVELLPAQSDSTSWVNELNGDKGREAGPVYEFSGGHGVIIPEAVLDHNLGPEFTISTWMKHEARSADKHGKEHILCLADDHRKNRHHASLFIRNCKLVLLLRRDYREDERNVFKPAEWRWSVPQVCDHRWHHYAVSVSPEGAELYLDGELWQPQQNNPEIIDDWPLHPAADLKTSLTVGACWHGHEMAMKHVLRGYLAGLSVLVGKREHSEVLKCLVQCSESLQLPATNLLEPGMEMVTNSHGTQVTIDGDNVDNMNTLVRQVAYLNTREFPAPGRRRLEMETKITCGDGTRLQVPFALSSILVLPVPQPIISISGTENMSREYDSFKKGVRVFADIKVIATRDEGDVEPSDEEESRLDRCSVSVFPPLNPDHEELHLPQAMLVSLNIVGSANINGAEIVGSNMVYNYEQVIRQVTYTNQKPAYYLNRQFKLACSQLNKRFVSNEFIETLTVIHPKYGVEAAPASPGSGRLVSHQQMSRFAADLPTAHFISQSKAYAAAPGMEQGNAVVVVVIVSMGLLITVLAVGVVKLKSAVTRDEEAGGESEEGWEDGPNITLNPLEASLSGEPSCQHHESEFDEGEGSEDEDEMYDEESDEEEEDETKTRLAWDKSV